MEINQNTQQLCKRKEKSSVLYNKCYKGLSEFKIDDVWEELILHHSFFIDVLNTITGERCDIINTPEKLKTKYCFIYSILMFSRWHELSLFQRVNTILLLEGGCSKQV
jgi:hypothetical protein